MGEHICQAEWCYKGRRASANYLLVVHLRNTIITGCMDENCGKGKDGGRFLITRKTDKVLLGGFAIGVSSLI